MSLLSRSVLLLLLTLLLLASVGAVRAHSDPLVSSSAGARRG